MAKDPQRYHIFVGGKTARSKPRLLKRVDGQKQAMNDARVWKEKHPERYVGVFQLKRVKVYKPKRVKVKRRR